MDFEIGLQLILDHLKKHGHARNSVLINLLNHDEKLFQEIKEELILTDQAEEKIGAGLIYLSLDSLPDKGEDGHQPAEETERSHHIFISYGRKDAEHLARKLKKDLTEGGHTVWLDKTKILGGASWEEQIEKAILSSDIFISLLTPYAVRRPDGVCLDEISLARFHNRKIVPVMVIQCRPPLSIYRLDWVDFTKWESELQYSKSVQRVFKALNSKESVEGLHAEIFGHLKPLDFGVEIARMTKDFTGRKWVFQEIEEWLTNSASRVFFITGDPGIGKSAIMAHLASRHPQVMAYHFCISSLADSLNPDTFVRSLSAQLSTQLEEYRAVLKQLNIEQLSRLDPGTLFRRLIADPLKRIELNERVIVLIDALDEAWDESGKNIVGILKERLEDLPEKVKIIVSSRKIHDIFDLLSKYRPYELDPGQSDNIKDISEYLDHKFKEAKFAEMLAAEAFAHSKIIDEIILRSEGNFLYIKQLIFGVESGQIDLNDYSSFPKGLVGIYVSNFDRIFSGKNKYDEYRGLLEAITCLKAPFNAQELAPIVQLSEFEIRRKMHTLSAFFRETEGRYYFFHKSITDWLAGTVGKGTKYLLDIEKGERRISNYFLEQYKQGNYTDYLVNYLPSHLIRTSMHDQLIHVLQDFNFLIQKCKRGFVYELIRDFHAALAILPESYELVNEEAAYQKSIQSYTRQLVLNPEKIQNGELSIKSLTPWDENRIDAEISRINKVPTTADILRLFMQFLDNQAHLIYKYVYIDGYIIQQAYNFASWGPFASRVNEYIKQVEHKMLLFNDNLREDFNPFNPCLRVFQEHTEGVRGVSLTYDGSHAVSGSNDNCLKLWDMQSGECLRTIFPHEDYVKSLDATPDLNLVVSSGGSQDPVLRLWNYKDLELRGELAGHTDRVNQVRITPNGRYIISCSNDDTVKVWDTYSMQCITTFTQHGGDVSNVDISLDGTLAVSNGYNGEIYVWEIPGGKIIQTFDDFEDHGFAVKLSIDKKVLYTCGGYLATQIQAWDLTNGSCIKTLIGHSNTVNSIELSHDGNYLVSASKDKSIKVWDLSTLKCVKTITEHVGPVISLSISPDLNFIISGGGGKNDNTARVWNVHKSKLHTGTPNSKNIKKIHFDPSGQYILNLSRNLIQLRNPDTGIIEAELQGHKTHIKQVWINTEGTVLISGSLDRKLMVWNPQTYSPVAVLEGHTDGILDFSISKNRDRLVSTGWDGQIIEWDLKLNKTTLSFRAHTESIEYVEYIHEDEKVLSIDSNSKVKIWDIFKGECLGTLRFPVSISALSTLDKSDNVYLGFVDGSVRYLDTVRMEMRSEFKAHDTQLSSLRLLEADNLLFTGAEDGSIRQWDVKKGTCLVHLKGHTDGILFIREIPGEHKIVTASRDQTIRVWDLASGNNIAVLSTKTLVTSLSKVQPDGRFAYGTMHGEFKVVNIT